MSYFEERSLDELQRLADEALTGDHVRIYSMPHALAEAVRRARDAEARLEIPDLEEILLVDARGPFYRGVRKPGLAFAMDWDPSRSAPGGLRSISITPVTRGAARAARDEHRSDRDD